MFDICILLLTDLFKLIPVFVILILIMNLISDLLFRN